MKAKKLISIILTIVMLCSVSVVSVMADETQQTLCQKVGIADNLSGNKVVQNGSGQLENNYQIVNLGDEIGVFSIGEARKITGKSLCAVLLGQTGLSFDADEALTSAGYKLEYITPEGTNGDKERVVDGGAVRATKDSDVINIPIVDTQILLSGGIGCFNAGGTSMSNQSKLVDKAFDASAYEIKVNSGATVSTARARIQNVSAKNTPCTIFTVECEVRLTGAAKLSVGERITLSADGKLKKTTYGGTATEYVVCSDAASWHHVALEYNYADNRVYVYYDGNRIVGDAGLCNSALGEFRFVMPDGTYTQDGTAQIYNCVIHRGAYTGRGISIADTAMNDNIGIDTAAKKIYYKDDSLTAADLKTALTQITDTTDVKLYADSTLAATAPAAITSGNAAVLRTASNTHFETYEIVKKADDQLLIASESGKIKARPIYNHASGQIMIAEYDASGTELLGIAIGTGANSAAIDDDTAAGKTYKAFIWNGTTNAVPLLTSVSYPLN